MRLARAILANPERHLPSGDADVRAVTRHPGRTKEQSRYHWRLPDIHALLAGESEREAGAERLALRRCEKTRELLEPTLRAGRP